VVGEAHVRVAGIGHSGNSTALDLLSDFVAITPATAGTRIADALRTRRDSQQHVAELRAPNDELRKQLRQVQMHRTTIDAATGSAAERNFITTSAERTNSAQVSARASDRNADRRDTAAMVPGSAIRA
jgi:exonuclease VII large subunit